MRMRPGRLCTPDEARVAGRSVEARKLRTSARVAASSSSSAHDEGLEELHGEAHQRGVGNDVRGHLEVATARAPAEAGPQIAELEVHPVDGIAPVRTVPTLPSRPLPHGQSGQRGGRVSLERALLREAVLGVLTDCLEHAVPRREVAWSATTRDLRTSESRCREDVHLVGVVDDCAEGGEVEAAGENRRGAQQIPLILRQQVVRPGHRVPQRVLTLGRGSDPLQQSEPVRESVPDLTRTHRRHPGGRQLDAQRQAVEHGADLDDRGGRVRVLQTRTAVARSGPGRGRA